MFLFSTNLSFTFYNVDIKRKKKRSSTFSHITENLKIMLCRMWHTILEASLLEFSRVIILSLPCRSLRHRALHAFWSHLIYSCFWGFYFALFFIFETHKNKKRNCDCRTVCLVFHHIRQFNCRKLRL